jgi:UPF0042 nucleotide-binding protein
MRKKKKNKVIIITGPSGAGKTTAINVLADIGFETIDNIPIELVDRVLSGPDLIKPLALGIDIRTRGFSAENLISAVNLWKENNKLSVTLLYLECQGNELEQRFNGTRRRHPLSSGNTLRTAILKEKDIIKTLRPAADIFLDTSILNPNGLKMQLIKFFNSLSDNEMVITIHSFSFKRSIPVGIDMLLDCRFLNNPYWVAELKDRSGIDNSVGNHIRQDKSWEEFFLKTMELLNFLLPKYRQEGKSYFSVGFGCSGGRHRSVFVTEMIARALRKLGWIITIDHRELEEDEKNYQTIEGDKEY